jgi:hypothetical protein
MKVTLATEEEKNNEFMLSSSASISSANESIVYIEKVKVENPTLIKGKIVYTA